MNMMATVAAVPAIAFTGAMPALAIDRHAWDETYVKFRAVEARYDELIDKANAADEAAELDCPRDPIWFEGKYHLSIGMSRERVRNVIASALTYEHAKQLVAMTRQSAGARLEACRAQHAEIDRLADEFMVYQERSRDADRRHKVHELRDESDAYGGDFRDAFDDLMEVAPPDTPAFVAKLELAANFGNDGDHYTIVEDAKRLFGEGRA